MADLGQAREIGTVILGKIISGSIIAFLILILGVIILGITLLVRYYRQFNVKVRIKTKRGTGTDGEPVYKIFYAKGGIIYNKKDKRSFFRILGERIDLPVPPFECMQISAGGGNEIEVVKESDSEYYYSLPSKITKGYILNKDGLRIKATRQKSRVLDTDVIYWNLLRKKDNRKLFDVEGTFMKMLPYIVPLILGVIIVFWTYVFLDKLPALLNIANQVAESLESAAVHLETVTTAQTAG